MSYAFSFYETLPAREEVTYGLVLGRFKFFRRVRTVPEQLYRRYVVITRGNPVEVCNRPEFVDVLRGLFPSMQMVQLESLPHQRENGAPATSYIPTSATTDPASFTRASSAMVRPSDGSAYTVPSNPPQQQFSVKGHWHRRLSEDELTAITGWNRLSERAPQLGQRCRVRLVHPNFPADEEVGECIDVSATDMLGNKVGPTVYGFRTPKGSLITEAQQTYWTSEND